MARIRSTHPDQWTDVEFVGCSPLARLLALGIRNFADDNGILPYDMVRWKMQVLPGDNCDMKKLAKELVESGQVHVYESDGKEYAIIRNFTRFQSPKSPTYTYPPPPYSEMDGGKVKSFRKSSGMNGSGFGNSSAGMEGGEGMEGRSSSISRPRSRRGEGNAATPKAAQRCPPTDSEKGNGMPAEVRAGLVAQGILTERGEPMDDDARAAALAELEGRYPSPPGEA